MIRTRHPLRGFSLVELVVTVAIIAILIALLIPAVQAARETARRITCTNNLRQIGIALHNYHATHTVFPFGYVNREDVPGWGWATMLLPQLEQGNLYDKLLVSVDFDGVATANTQTSLDVFICPSDVGPRINAERGGHAKSNYAGVAGSIEIEDWDEIGNGVFYVNSRTRFSEIADGTNRTFAVGERRYNFPNGNQKGAIWIGKHAPEAYGATIWSCVHAPPHHLNGTKEWAFSSQHPNGVNFLMCDGSVQFINEKIDLGLYEAYAQRDNGPEMVDF